MDDDIELFLTPGLSPVDKDKILVQLRTSTENWTSALDMSYSYYYYYSCLLKYHSLYLHYELQTLYKT